MVKQKRKTVYVAKSTGRTWDTREEAIKDNINYKKDIHYRYSIKAGNYKSPYKNYNIPFIPKKKITLTNAGLATGAVLSTNLLDSIAVNAERAGLPIKTAIGLAAKESTLNNPTYDIRSRAKIARFERSELKKAKELGFEKNIKPKQNIGTGDTPESLLINYNPDDNPYSSATKYILQKAKTWEDNLRMMRENEAYADRQAIRKQAQPSKSYLQAGFELYKRNPQGYNPGQPNYPQLVQQRANEVWGSPEVQNWYKTYRKRKFEEGGKIMPKRSLENAGISDAQYLQIMERVAEQNYKRWGLPSADAALVQALNDNTYNYRGYYNKYPNGKGNAVDHWPDEFKTVYHPTFSKESKYSGKKSQYNPKGLTGGTWYGEYFVPSVDLLLERIKYKNGGILPAITVKPKRNLENKGHKDSSFWDTVDNYANYAEKALALSSLASMGATIAVPNPITAGLAIGSNLGGVVVDGYQGMRSVIKGDYANAIKNGGELVLSLIGAKALSNASKLSRLDDALRASGATRQYVTKTIGRRAATRHSYVTTKEADAATKASAVGYSTSVAGNASSMGEVPTRIKHKDGGIHIAPSKRGTFTAAATKHGMGVQEFASKVLANKENYSPAMVKKANFARNSNKWNH